ncbi:MAG: ATP-binding protein [Pseudomonadota bacterium]
MSFAEIAALTIHDVKNSLAQLAGQAEARGDAATLRIALNASEALTRLLVFYKSENNILQLAVDAHVPADLITELATELVAEHRDVSAISIIVDDTAAPTLWHYDKTLVRMLLANAIHNALRFAQTCITISAREMDGFLEFEVRDDGAGYPENVLSDEDGSAAISEQGTGLGLLLAKRVAQMHENAGQYGEIRLFNDLGAVFVLRLPS